MNAPSSVSVEAAVEDKDVGKTDDPNGLALPDVAEVVAGKYRLVRRLGEGGMGLVFEAEHLRLRQSVAIKFLRPEVLAMPDAVARFEREARASCCIRGPHVVQVLDVDTDECGRPFMVMELLRGRDLEAEIRERGALPVTEAVDWVLQACAAVSEAHQARIVHRDLKPSNLFLAEEFGTRVVKVLDFGISKIQEGSEPTMTGMAVTMGTPLYMSPEQVRSSRDVDCRTDVWSLGVILYELIAGAPPFSGTTTAAIAAIVADATPGLRECSPHVPPELEKVVMTTLAKSPDDRFPTVEALAAALVPFASAEGANGPYSLRPSQRAFEVASQTMARAPAANRATSSAELLRMRPSRTSRHSSRTSQPWWETTRTLGGTVAIGVALATAVSMATAASTRGRAGSRPSEGHALMPSSSEPILTADSVQIVPASQRLPDASSSAELTTPHPPDGLLPSVLVPPSPARSAAPAAPHRSAEAPHARIERPLYL